MSFSCMEKSLWRFWREGPGCVFFSAGFGIVSLWQGCDLHRQKMFDQGCISMYLARRASYSIKYWKFASLCEYVHWEWIWNVMLLGPITQTQKSIHYLFYLRTSGQVTRHVSCPAVNCVCEASYRRKEIQKVNAASARGHNPQQIFTH